MLDEFHKIFDTLEVGGTILYPTDTIWGIGCDATNPQAIEKIQKIKNRPDGKPFIILVSDVEMLKSYVKKIHPRIETLLVHHVRPLTVIYPSNHNLPIHLENDKGGIAIRLVQEPFIRELIKSYGKPITSTSANVHGRPFPISFGEIESNVISSVDYIVKYRQHEKCKDANPSVLASYDKKGNLIFLRS